MLELRLFARAAIVASLIGWATLLPLMAQEQPAGQVAAKYGADVVAKADKILEDVGLRRSGKTIRSTNTAEIARAISGLARQKRELKLVADDWKKTTALAFAQRAELKRLDAHQGELNLQLARVAGVDTSANNRLVGLIEATRTKMRALSAEEKETRSKASEKRVALNEAEASYAETVLAIRRDFNLAQTALDKSIAEVNVQIALKVVSQNHETPADLSAATVLASLEKRIEKIEQEIFSETIKLDMQSGSLYVNVVVGKQTARMVIDSGATLVSLPSQTAAKLGIKVPLDARELRMVMADGRSISGRLVTLPRVRVGEFEAENVDAAILDPVAVGAQPLLGMSFLSNFKFEIDAADKSLKMLRVSTD